MKRIITVIALILLLTVHSSAAEYEYSYSNGTSVDNETDKFISSIPEDIKDKITDISTDTASDAAEKYNFYFFANEILDALKNAAGPALTVFSRLCALIIVTSLFHHISVTIGSDGCEKAFRLCSSLCIVLAIYSIHKPAFEIAEALLSTLTSTMLLITPLIEAIYISGGNATTATVSNAGIALMTTLTEAIYSKILTPAVSVSFILASVSAATGNKGISFLSKSLRWLITTAIIITMTLMSIIMTMQTNITAAADTFAGRAVRFALGSYIPIIGGSVSESLSVVGQSLSLIKKFSGITGIVVIILLFIPPFINLLMCRLSLSCASAFSGIIGCDSEKTLLDEIGGIYTMLICITLSAAIMFVYAISLFSSTSLALT